MRSYLKPSINALRRSLGLFGAIFLGLLLTYQALPQSAQAISAKQQRLYRQNILYYDLDTGCDSATVNSVTPTTSKKAYMLGDSITLGSKDKIISGFNTKGVDATVNGSVSRSITRPGVTVGNKTSGLQALDSAADKAAIKDPDNNTVIIALGTNGEGSSAQFKKNLQNLINKFKSLKQGMNFYVVNIFSPAVTQKDDYNAMLSSFAASGGFTLIDTTNQHITTGGDNIHPDGDGQQTFANTVVNAVAGGSAAASDGSAPQVGGSCVCGTNGSTTTSLAGGDNEAKTWNYFIAKGLSPIQVAGIMGNMARESGFNPENIQNPGGDSKDPNDAGSGGWGIIQWTPGRKILDVASQARITGPIYELSTQLDIVWWHMNNTSPTGQRNMLAVYKPSDEKEAARLFEHLMEGAGIPAYADREAAASGALQKYGGGAGATLTTSSSPTGASCTSTAAGGDSSSVNADGYALPVLKAGINLPCGKSTCHHDGTPAADLGIAPKWEGTPVFAITSGTIDNMHYRAGPSGNAPQECISLHIVGDDGWDYWYGHIRKPLVKNGEKVKAGQKIAEIGESACADDTPPHLHIDRGSPKGAGGGNECCRDPGFIPLLDKIYEDAK